MIMKSHALDMKKFKCLFTFLFLLFAATGWAHVDVAMAQRQRFVGKTDKPLDVILFRIAGELEDDHIPAIRVRKRVGKLTDQDPITAEGRVVGITGEVE